MTARAASTIDDERGPGSCAVGAIRAAARALTARIAARAPAPQVHDLPARLALLSRIFALDDGEAHLLLLCLAPDACGDPGTAARDDEIAAAPVGESLLVRTLSPAPAGRPPVQERLRPTAPLCRHRLLIEAAPPLHGGQRDGGDPRERLLRVDPRIVDFLLGSARIDDRALAVARCVDPHHEPTLATLDAELFARLRTVVAAHFDGPRHTDGKLLLALNGRCGLHLRALAEALACDLETRLLIVDAEALLRESDLETTLRRALREALLQPALVYFENAGHLAVDDERAAVVRRLSFEVAEELAWLAVFGSDADLAPPDGVVARNLWLSFDVPAPTAEQREALWTAWLAGAGSELGVRERAAIAAQFRFTAGQIRRAASLARGVALSRGVPAARVGAGDVREACRLVSSERLVRHGRKIRPTFRWDDLVVPPDCRAQLAEICACVTNRSTVLETWGFATKLALGRGLNVLFAGPSGTGKTMAADVIAGELGCDLYKVDLSLVVSKYVGETEKNLSRVFADAEAANAILFFDEADALFGKRSEVKDAHDRYANIEIDYLLQRMEEHEGVVILSTNLRKNVDEAFLRRFHFVVELPLPDETHRERIWRSVFPPAAPLAPDVDFPFLARRLKFSGGSIKSVAVNAAFLAAASGGVIGMQQLMIATRREMQKLGRSCVRSDFDEYYHLLGDVAEG